MTAPPVPANHTALAAVFRLSWKRLVRGKKLRLGAVAVVLIVIAVVAARYSVSEADPAAVMRQGIEKGFFALLVYLLPFLFTSGAIAEEVESRTFSFLIARPASRFMITLGKYCASTAMTVALLAGGLLVMHIAVFATSPTPMIDELPLTLKAMGAISLLAGLYSAICMFWGAIAPEAAGIVSALYLGVIEFVFGMLPWVLRFASMNYFATLLVGLDKGGLMPETVPDVPLFVAPLALAVEVLVFLGLAILVVRTSEYRHGKA